MPKTRPPYPSHLRARLIELARSGRSPEDLGARLAVFDSSEAGTTRTAGIRPLTTSPSSSYEKKHRPAA